MSRIKIPMDLRSWKPTFRNKRERWPTRQCEQRMWAKRNVGRTLLSVAFDPDLDLDLDLDCPSILRLFLVSGPDQGQKRRTGVSVPHKPSAARPLEKRMGTLTSHVENQNPHGLTPAESQLSQRTRQMGHPAGNSAPRKHNQASNLIGWLPMFGALARHRPALLSVP